METKVKLTDEQIKVLKSMNVYWEEISKRDNHSNMQGHEMNQMLSVINMMDVLLIVGEYAKNYNSK